MINNQLLYLSPEVDIDGFVELRRSLMIEHPKLSMFTSLLDAHFYIFEKWVCDYLACNEYVITTPIFLKIENEPVHFSRSILSIKGELLPLIVKKQYSRGNVAKEPSKSEDDPHDTSKETLEKDEKDIFSFIPHDEMEELTQQLSSWNDHPDDLKGAYRGRPLRCYAFIQETGACYRANNLHSYCELNRQITKLMPSVAPGREQPLIHSGAQIQPKAQVRVVTVLHTI